MCNSDLISARTRYELTPLVRLSATLPLVPMTMVTAYPQQQSAQLASIRSTGIVQIVNTHVTPVRRRHNVSLARARMRNRLTSFCFITALVLMPAQQELIAMGGLASTAMTTELHAKH